MQQPLLLCDKMRYSCTYFSTESACFMLDRRVSIAPMMDCTDRYYRYLMRYITRHAKREDWNKSGLKTAGYWSKHLLWNKDTLTKSINDISKKHNLNIKMK